MIAREWKARCPQRHKAGFTEHLRRTGVHDATATPGFLGAQILVRDIGDNVEFTLITYWDSLAAITAFPVPTSASPGCIRATRPMHWSRTISCCTTK